MKPLYLNKKCTCGKTIRQVEDFIIAPQCKFRMPGVYYKCPYCLTGLYIPANKENEFYNRMREYVDDETAWEIANKVKLG